MRTMLGALALVLAGCGRCGFESPGIPDAGVDSQLGVDAQLVLGQVALGNGGDAHRIIAPEGSLMRLYVVFGKDRLMTSADGGATFTDCGRVPMSIVDLVGSPTGDVYVAGSNGVFESHERCATFQDTGLSVYTGAIEIDGAGLMAGTGSGLRRRIGTTWSALSSPLTGTYVNDLHVGSVYLASSSNGIARSTNGTTWALSNTGLQSLDVFDFAVAGSRIYVTTNNGVHVSIDGGVSWTQTITNFGDVIGADPGDPQFVAHWRYNGLIVSANGGTTWSLDARTPNMVRPRIQGIVFDPAGSGRVIMATARGLFQAPDHSLAFQQIGDVDAWSVSSIARASASDTMFYATTSGLIRETATGLTLLDPGGADFSDIIRVIAPGDGSTIHTTGRTLMTSSDQGETFTSAYDPVGADSYLTIGVHSEIGRLLVSTKGRVGLSTGGAWTFRALTPALSTNELLVTSTAILVATELGVYASVDGGTSYTLTAGLTRETWALVELSDGSVLAGTASGIYRAASPGGAWVQHALPTIAVPGLIQIGTKVVAAVGDRVMYSTNNGVSFAVVPGFSGQQPRSFGVDSTGKLMVGTAGYGLHRIELP